MPISRIHKRVSSNLRYRSSRCDCNDGEVCQGLPKASRRRAASTLAAGKLPSAERKSLDGLRRLICGQQSSGEQELYDRGISEGRLTRFPQCCPPFSEWIGDRTPNVPVGEQPQTLAWIVVGIEYPAAFCILGVAHPAPGKDFHLRGEYIAAEDPGARFGGMVGVRCGDDQELDARGQMSQARSSRTACFAQAVT